MENWLPIVGFEGLYEVSDLGRVKSLGRVDALGRRWPPKLMKDGPSGAGYRKVDLRKAGRYCAVYVHVAVLTAFKGLPVNGQEGAHRNGVRVDNKLWNLAWKTHAQNEADKIAHGTKLEGAKHPSARLSEADVQMVRESRQSAESLAEDLGVTANHIRGLRRGRYWSHV